MQSRPLAAGLTISKWPGPPARRHGGRLAGKGREGGPSLWPPPASGARQHGPQGHGQAGPQNGRPRRGPGAPVADTPGADVPAGPVQAALARGAAPPSGNTPPRCGFRGASLRPQGPPVMPGGLCPGRDGPQGALGVRPVAHGDGPELCPEGGRTGASPTSGVRYRHPPPPALTLRQSEPASWLLASRMGRGRSGRRDWVQTGHGRLQRLPDLRHRDVRGPSSHHPPTAPPSAG